MPPLTLFLLPDGTEVSLVSIENQPYLVQSVSLDDLKWNIHYLTPIKELDDTVNTVMLIAAILMLLVLVVILLTIERRQKSAQERRCNKRSPIQKGNYAP